MGVGVGGTGGGGAGTDATVTLAELVQGGAVAPGPQVPDGGGLTVTLLLIDAGGFGLATLPAMDQVNWPPAGKVATVAFGSLPGHTAPPVAVQDLTILVRPAGSALAMVVPPASTAPVLLSTIEKANAAPGSGLAGSAVLLTLTCGATV